MFIHNAFVKKLIHENKDKRFVLEAHNKDYQVWHDTLIDIRYCQDRSVDEDLHLWHEVELLLDMEKAQYESLKSNIREYDDVVTYIRLANFNIEYTKNGVVYVKLYRFKHIKHVYAYIRCEMYGRETFEEQKQLIEDYCNTYLNYPSIEWYVDVNCPGGIPINSRTIYKQLHEELRKNDSSILVVSELGIISRKPTQLFTELYYLLENNVRIATADGFIDSISPSLIDVSAHTCAYTPIKTKSLVAEILAENRKVYQHPNEKERKYYGN